MALCEPDRLNKPAGNKGYHLYGYTLQTAENFDGFLCDSADPPDLSYRVLRDVTPEDQKEAAAVYQSRHPASDGAPRLLIWKQGDRYQIRIAESALWELTRTSITCSPYPYAMPEQLLIDLFGSIMSWWLEWQGILTLHASAIVIEQRSMAFLASNKGGKSTLAAEFLSSESALLTDDVLALNEQAGRFVGYPSYPQMRLWPDEARHFLGNTERLKRVHPNFNKFRIHVENDGLGTFCQTAQPLACIYVPDRRDPASWGSDIQFKPLSQRDALLELIRYSFSAIIVEALGWQTRRLESLTRLIQRVPLRRLIYPSGFEYLPAVRKAILEDLAHNAA